MSATLTLPDIQKHKDRVIIIITKTVHSSIFPIVSRLCNDPSKLWVTLKKKYESSTLQRKLNLKTSLIELKMHDGTSIEDYLKKVDHHVMDLGSIGEEIPDKELIQIVLRNLPKSWSSFKSIYGVLYSKEKDSTFADLEEHFQAEEMCRKPRLEAEEHSLAATRWQRNDFSNRTRGRGGRGHGGRSRGAGRGELCNYCGKRGHWESDCYIKSIEHEVKAMSPAQLRDMQLKARELKNPTQKSFLADHGDIGDSRSDRGDNGDSKLALSIEALLSEFELVEKPIPQNNTQWILYSGATSHISKDKEYFLELSSQSPVTNVITPSGTKMPASGSGCISISKNKAIYLRCSICAECDQKPDVYRQACRQ